MQRFITDYGYLAIMLFGGAVAGGAVAGSHLNLAVVVVAGVLGNLAGSYVAWGVGRFGGPPAWRRWGRYLLLRPHDLDRAEQWFAKHGTKAVFFGRLLPVIRTFISLPAGFAAMPPARFGLYTLAGCIPWTLGLAAAGYAVGSNWRHVADGFHTPTYLIAALAALAILAAAGVRWRHRHADLPTDSARGTAGEHAHVP